MHNRPARAPTRNHFLAPALAIVIAGSALLFSPPAAADGVELTPYGYVRLDGSWDDSRLNDHQVPQYVIAEPNGADDNDTSFTWHTRLTRLGLKLASPQVAPGVDLAGKVEVDFYGGGSDTRHMLRMRLAYVTIQNRGFEFLIGQNWSVISPTYPAFNDDAVGWNVGSPGDRRRQVRITYSAKIGDSGKLDVIAAAVPAGGIDNQDLDGNGYKDGDDSGVPGFMGRLTLTMPLITKSPAQFGVWGAWQRESLATPLAVNDEDTFTGYIVGGNIELPLHDMFAIRGEGWIAQNGNDYRAGIGQGINPETGDAVKTMGGFAEAVIKPIPRWSAHLGFSADDPDADTVASDGRTLNRLFYVVNKVNPYGTLWFGQEYGHWTTKYNNGTKGVDNRFELWVMYKF